MPFSVFPTLNELEHRGAIYIQIYLCGNWMWILWKENFHSCLYFTPFAATFPAASLHNANNTQKNKAINFSSEIFATTERLDVHKTKVELANFKLQPTLIKSIEFLSSCNCNAASTLKCNCIHAIFVLWWLHDAVAERTRRWRIWSELIHVIVVPLTPVSKHIRSMIFKFLIAPDAHLNFFIFIIIKTSTNLHNHRNICKLLF